MKRLSRTKQWAKAASDAVVALEALELLRQEYEDWRNNLPENLQSSALGEKLSAVCDLDLQSAVDCAQEAYDAELPLGFGRD